MFARQWIKNGVDYELQKMRISRCGFAFYKGGKAYDRNTISKMSIEMEK